MLLIYFAFQPGMAVGLTEIAYGGFKDWIIAGDFDGLAMGKSIYGLGKQQYGEGATGTRDIKL